MTCQVSLTNENVVEVLNSSKIMLLDQLNAICQLWLIKNIDKDNVVSLLQGLT